MLALADGLTIDCYFFAIYEIEFSLDPREVRGLHERTVGKKVRLTPENCSNLPFVEFDPALDTWSKVMLGPDNT